MAFSMRLLLGGIALAMALSMSRDRAWGQERSISAEEPCLYTVSLSLVRRPPMSNATTLTHCRLLADVESPSAGAPVAASIAHAKANLLSGRVKFLAADSVTHFRYMDTGPGRVTARDEYYKVSTRVQINFVREGNTYLQARGESGRNFQASYDFTGIGDHKAYWSFNLKSLFLGQKIGHHLEAQAGGIEFDPGSGSEVTYADNDAWLEGYRLRYAGQIKKFGPDKISVTVGYVGDFLQPNAFARFHRMGEENYIQVLAGRKWGSTRDLSAEFDSIQSIRFTREAFRWQKLPVPVVQDLTLETIVRASDNPTFGWSGTLSRAIDRKARLRLGMFYSDMPAGIFKKNGSAVFLNGDCYLSGKRIGPTVKVVPFSNAEISLFGGARVDNTPGTRYRGQVAFRYQFASLLNGMLR